MRTVWHSLALLCATGIVAASLIFAGSLWGEYRGGYSAQRAFDAKDVTADILPPPMYLIELRLVLSKAVEGTMSLALAHAETDRLEKVYLDRASYWTRHPPHGLEGKLLGRQHNAAKRFIAAARYVLQALGSGNPDAVSSTLRAADAVYLEHRASVDDTVKASTTFADSAISDFEATARGILWLQWAVFGTTSLLLLGFGFWVHQRITRPINRAITIAQSVAMGDLSSQIEVTSQGETGRLLGALKNMSESLRANEQRFRAMTGLSVDWYWEQDQHYRFTKISGDKVLRSGVTAEAHTGKTLWELGYVDMDEAIWQFHREQLEMREPFRDFEIRRLDDAGKLCMLSISGTPKVDASGTFVGYHGVARDVSARLVADAQSRTLESQLRESQKMESIRTLAGGIAHDFNNILGAILGNVALARQDLGEGHPASTSLEQINQAGLRARRLVQQILTFSRSQTQSLATQALRPRVEEAVELLRATMPEYVAVKVVLVETPLYALIDAKQFQLVLINLCTNALHALKGRRGAIVIGLDSVVFKKGSARCSAGLPPGHYAHVSVRDNGCGMNAATKARIFEPFYTTKPVGQGTGLGLSVVHGIVATHHGSIQVDSAPGQGSTFHLYFPLMAEHSDNAPQDSLLLSLTRGQRPHVLYLADDEVMMSAVEQMLQRLSYQVTCHGDARAAVTALRERPDSVDLVLIDFNTPQASGLVLASELTRIRPDLLVVMCSGPLSEEVRAEATRHGVSGLFNKENSIEELGLMLQRVLSPVSG